MDLETFKAKLKNSLENKPEDWFINEEMGRLVHSVSGIYVDLSKDRGLLSVFSPGRDKLLSISYSIVHGCRKQVRKRLEQEAKQEEERRALLFLSSNANLESL